MDFIYVRGDSATAVWKAKVDSKLSCELDTCQASLDTQTNIVWRLQLKTDHTVRTYVHDSKHTPQHRLA